MGFPGQSSKCAENNLRIVWFCSLSIPVQSFSQILCNGPTFLQPAWDVPSRVLGDLTVLEVAWWPEQQTEYWSGTSGSKPRCWEQLMIGGIPFFHYWLIAIHHNSNSISFDQSVGRGLFLLDSFKLSQVRGLESPLRQCRTPAKESDGRPSWQGFHLALVDLWAPRRAKGWVLTEVKVGLSSPLEYITNVYENWNFKQAHIN